LAGVDDFVERLNSDKFAKKKIEFGDNTLYMNFPLEEFKNSVLTNIRSTKHATDGFFNLFGMETYGESRAGDIEKYFESDKFEKAVASPAFALRSLKLTFVDYKKIINNKNINIDKFYNAKITPDKMNEAIVSGINRENERQNYRLKINNLFRDWAWFLQGIGGNAVVGIDEISRKNLDLGWVVLHEAAHIYDGGGIYEADTIASDKETALIKEMHSDLYAAIYMPSDGTKEHYQRIDSMMFSRLMTMHNASHFTVVPLMALKIILSKPGVWSSHMQGIRKEELVRAIIEISKDYVGTIIEVVNNKNNVKTLTTVQKLKTLVKNIVLRVDKEYLLN
jgi:hypothetical protein